MNCPFIRWTLKRPGIIIQVFFLSLLTPGQAQDYITDPVSISLGGCYSVSAESYTGIYNEAFLGIKQSNSFHFSHARPFVAKELGLSSLSAGFLLYPGMMQLGIQQFGIPGFQQINACLAYGMRLSNSLYAGIGFKYYNTSSVGHLTYLRSLGISGGLLVIPDSRTALAVHIINPVTINNYCEYGSVFPALITLGLKREIYKDSNIYTEMQYSTVSILRFKIAAEYAFVKNIILRAGYHFNPPEFSFGTGLSYDKMKLDMAFSYSMRIGVTPALKISYTPRK